MNTLIPPEEYKLFVQNNCFHLGDLQRFAERIGVSVGIVVAGCKMLDQFWYNGLRVRFECMKSEILTLINRFQIKLLVAV